LHDARTERAGLSYAALCVVNAAFVPAVAKLTTGGADPVFVAAATTGFAALAAAVVLGARGELGFFVRRDTGPRLVLIGFLGTTLSYLLFFEGASRTTAIDTVLCLQSEPVYALLVAWLFLGHRLTFRRVLSVGILGLGILLAVGGGGRSDPVGVALLLATPICWQASHLVVLRGLVGVPPPVLTGARYVHGGLLLALFWLVRGAPTGVEGGTGAVLERMPLLALQGVMLSYVGTLLWYQAITRLDLARATAIVVPSIPVVSLAASFVLVGEVPSARQCGGLLLVSLGVLAFVLAPHAVEVRERIPAATAPLGAPADPADGGDQA
jgi:drug/metabolite transporter (DMT)-like permease